METIASNNKAGGTEVLKAYGKSWWEGTHKFQRMLANQVFARLEYFNKIDQNWEELNVLDLGCGCGFMSEALAKRGAHVTGVEPDADFLEVVGQHAKQEGLQIKYKRGIGEKIPIEDNSMDKVVCVDVLEHVEDLRKVISEVRRVLKPGGIFYFDTINRNHLSKFLLITLTEKILGSLPCGAHDPSKFIKPEELRQYLYENEFNLVHFTGMGIKIKKNFKKEFGLTSSIKVMYIGHAV